MLRKRRRGGGGNNDFDLSDSDDGDEARRRMKRRQFAKMQKALFADERIGKIAENPRNAAFLKSIEDRNSDDDEWDFGENFAEAPESGADSESQSQGQVQIQQQQQDGPAAETLIPDSQPSGGERKRTHADEHAPRPPPNARRTKGGVRPSSLTDVRRELSDLLDEPNGSAASIIPATEVGSDSEDEARPTTSSSTASNKENRRPDVAVVDRIKLKRDSSSLSTGSNGPSSRLAFAAPSASDSGFKVPALLRRATTNSLLSTSSSTSTSTSTGGGGSNTHAAKAAGEESKLLKKTAGKKSGINYFARENERRAAVADKERRREAKKWKGVEGRGKVVGGLFGGGTFE
jgi:mediator of replication checkpoint protein 1